MEQSPEQITLKMQDWFAKNIANPAPKDRYQEAFVRLRAMEIATEEAKTWACSTSSQLINARAEQILAWAMQEKPDGETV